MPLRPDRLFAFLIASALMAACATHTYIPSNAVMPTALPSSAAAPAAVKFSPASSAFVADQGPQTIALAVAVNDASGAAITGNYATPITVSVTDSGAHVTLSLDGTTKASSVTLSSSTDASKIKVFYDGNAAAGYSAKIGVTAPAAASATLNAFTVSGGAGYASKTVGLAANHQVTLTAAEANFSGTFTATNTCSNTAVVSSPVQSGASAQITVTGGLAVGSCAVTISDGSTQYPAITVNNAVDGASPAPLPSQTSGGNINGGSTPLPLPTPSGNPGGVGTTPSPLPLPT